MIEDQKYYLTDYESGYPYEVTKKDYDRYMRLWESLVPKMERIKGTIIVFGTGSDLDNNNADLNDLFYNLNNEEDDMDT